MDQKDEKSSERSSVKRRDFVKSGGAALTGGVVLGRASISEDAAPRTLSRGPSLFPVRPSQEGRIQDYRTLGRTGFKVSDIAIGAGFMRDANVVRYAIDKGINYFDTAESYENGQSERAIGEALQHVDRSKVFVASKAHIRPEDDTEVVLEKARRSLERLNTEYMDAYKMQWVNTVEWLSHPGYHAAMDQLKAEGRVRFTGVAYHGPEQTDQTGMADILCAAAEDGRFDVLLFVHNFLNHSEGDRVLETAKANNVATTGMKTAPGKLRAAPLDPENLTEVQQQFFDAIIRSGQTREAALEYLRNRAEAENNFVEGTLPFAERYGIQTDEALRLASIQWVLQDRDMHTACITATSFDFIDKIVALSGTKLTPAAEDFILACRTSLNSQYCRHGCVECMDRCPLKVPVSNIMRYAYYFETLGQERHAMAQYAALDGPGAAPCKDCAGLCAGACRYGLAIQPNMLQVHDLLTLA